MSTSDTLFQRACKVIPGGVNSPVRAFRGVGGTPVFFSHGDGPYLYDVEGKRYVDYVCSWGPLILGHAHPAIIKAVITQASQGLSFGAPTPLEIEMAEMLCSILPSLEMTRMVNSGTEAAMSAIRLARGYTKRSKILKFEGCYHGHVDSLLVKAGSGALTLGQPTSPGIPSAVTEDTLVLDYNDSSAVRALFEQCGKDIACVIVEPVAGNMNCVLPVPGFLQCLREECSRHGALLIFDEVMTGFRVGLGGAQQKYGIRPDLTTLGKVIGGGLPVGAFGGARDIMSCVAPMGPVYQAGTLSGNPMAMAAGLATLKEISAPGFYEDLTARTAQLLNGLQSAADTAKVPFTTAQAGTMFGLFFTHEKSVSSFAQATQCNIEMFKRFYHEMLQEGVYLAPSAYEAGFMSAAHTPEIVDGTIAAAARVFRKL